MGDSGTEECAALDSRVAIHDASRNLDRVLSPAANGDVSIGELASGDTVTIFDENDSTVRAVTITESRLPPTIEWTVSNYQGTQGDCYTLDQDEGPEFEAVVTNAAGFDSVELGPDAKFLRSSGQSSDRAILMAEDEYRVFAGGYAGAEGESARLTDYGLTDLGTPAEGSTVDIEASTAATPYAVSLPSTVVSIGASWIDPDTGYPYELESINVNDTNRDQLNSLNVIEPSVGELAVRHVHFGDPSAGQAQVNIVEILDNVDTISLSNADLSALTNVNRSGREISYQFTDSAGEGERIQDVRATLFGFGFGGEKTFSHTLISDSVEPVVVLPDLSSLIQSPTADITTARVEVTIAANSPLVQDFIFGSSGFFGVSNIDEGLGTDILTGEFRTYYNSFLQN
jgi:hypothetical protein